MPDRRTFLTNPDDFTDVSRGNPLPHTLTGEALDKARLTADTWRLEIEAEGAAKIDHPKKLDCRHRARFARPACPRPEARRQVLEGHAMQQHRPAAGPGAVGGRAPAQRSSHRRENARCPPGLLLGLSQQRPQADVPIVAGDQPGARHAAGRIAPVHRLSAQRPADPARARRAGAHAHPLGPRLQVRQMAPAHHAHQRLPRQRHLRPSEQRPRVLSEDRRVH